MGPNYQTEARIHKAATETTLQWRVFMDFDELQDEVEKLLALLKDRQPGLVTWNELLADRLVAIQKLIRTTDLPSR